MATVAVNAFAPSQPAGWAGVIAGGAALVAGLARLDESDATKDVAIANLLIGGGALSFGLYTALKPSTISPMVVPAAGGARVGLAMHTTF